MLAGSLCIANYCREVAVKGIDNGAIALRIDTTLAAGKESACGCLELFEGCSPLPQHANSLSNICSDVKAQFTKSRPPKRQTQPPGPTPHSLFPLLNPAS